MTTFIIGNMVDGRRIQTLRVLSGSWVDTLNSAGSITAKVSLRDPLNRGLGLRDAATPGKTFLAAVEGNIVLQAGPIWTHSYDRDAQTLEMSATGMWGYFDHRVVLPVLAGRLPTDPTTDTVYTTSYQGMVRNLVAQAQLATGGNVPVILPAAITGTFTRTYRGSDLGMVGGRISELTQILMGPDVRFVAQFTPDKLGIQWTLLIGTPTQPLLFSPLDVFFRPTAARTSITALQVKVDGGQLASATYATGGRSNGTAISTVSLNSTLTAAGYPLLETVDSSHQTVEDTATLQGYSDDLVKAGKTPIETWSFTHDVSQSAPFLGTFNVGDFAQVQTKGDPYITDGPHRMRITQIGSDEVGHLVPILCQPEVT